MQLKHYLLALILLLNFVPLSFAQDARPIVKLIYFLPKDNEPQPDIDEKMDRLIRDTQQFYADQMRERGFSRKTFLFKTDARGKAVVHRMIGQHTDKYYTDLPDTVNIWEEIENQFDMSRNYYLTAIDISSERIVSRGRSVCGIGGARGNTGGRVLIPASGNCLKVKTAAHELGHAFGLQHDFRDNTYIMSYGDVPNRISKCSAEWLDVHPAFNTAQPTANTHTKVEMLPPSLAAPPNAIRLRFKISDPDGLHQVQLLTPTLTAPAQGFDELLSCKTLHGNTSTTVEFVTTDLTPKNRYVSFQVININGNFSWGRYPIDVSPLLPPPEVVSIPDPHLAAAIRESIDLGPNDAITTHTMLSFKRFSAPDRGITDLTGLKHAHNLTSLDLGRNRIADVAPLVELTQLTTLNLRWNKIADVAPLAELTQLKMLSLYFNGITDVAPLAELTQLKTLNLALNKITDVSPLAELTQLKTLNLGHNNSIIDVSFLAELTQLTELDLRSNKIVNVAPLAELIQLKTLDLGRNRIADVAPLAELTQLKILDLSFNYIADVAPLVGLNLTGTEQDIGLDLRGNRLSYASINIHIPAIQARGFEVEFDNIAHPMVQKISGDNQETFAGKVPSSPFVVKVIDEKGKPMQGVSVTFTVNAGDRKITDRTTTTDANGHAQTTLTLGWTPGINTVHVSVEEIHSETSFTTTVILPENRIAADVNADAVVDIEDLVLVAATIGMTPPEGILPNTDVNGDGIVNKEDIALVLAALESVPASPASVWTTANLQRWIDKAKQHNISDPTFRQGIAVLEQLLATWQPKANALLANYPNPFNPETWIPYQLATPADVSISIYTADGKLVRTLDLGHRQVGIYESRSRAAYWDGKNNLGEPVASSVYFYTLTAGDFTATRRMLILK